MGTRTVDGVTVRIEETIWNEVEDSPLYDVYRVSDGLCLSEESFDTFPSDRDIRYLVLSSWHLYHAAPEIGCSSCEAIDPGTWRERLSE
jgi:hypothetical protein